MESDLDWALAHIETFGDTDLFPTPFEYKAIRYNWDNIKQFLLSQDILKWVVRPNRILLSPKAKYGFRVITQIDPIDSIIYSALIHHISQDIEEIRIPIEDQIVFSYRAQSNPNGTLFNPSVGYRDFLTRCREIIEGNTDITHIVVTDISDFYSKIYLHRLENALRSSNADSNYISSIMYLLSGWNGSETYGIPVGNAPSRLLAEATLSDVDSSLRANGINFIRYNDDYRIFSQSHTDAYRSLAYLAEILNRNHGLTLQQQKTDILSSELFKEKYLITPQDKEINKLHEKFDDLIEVLDLDDPYDYIDYDDLTEEQQDIIDSLNLQEILRNEITESEPDLPVVRFILRRLTQLRDDSFLDEILDNIDSLHPAFPDIIKYIAVFADLDESRRHQIGDKLLHLFENSIVSELDYHKLWCLYPFSETSLWNQSDKFLILYNKSVDDISKRKLILALGRSNQRHWFQTQWRNLSNFSPWIKRAVIAGASCMPSDARKHWYRSIKPQLDILEQSIASWAKNNPFS
ncbi:RNA-directed DNA polymerase [bacterium]|nr:MAG: RNA-directed DNA polymerase [bacterium]